jgi:hypothetical protein
MINLKKNQQINRTIMMITSNKSKRHYTIRKNGVVYQTEKLTKEEFDNFAYNTNEDWQNYLRKSQSYTIKK